MSVGEVTMPVTADAPPARGRQALIALVVVGIVFGVVIVIAVLARGGGAALAELRIRDDNVDVGSGPERFARGVEGQGLSPGDIVRTDGAGQAQVDYFDGSLTRLDARTTFVIRELQDSPRARKVSIELNVGRTWNRVERLTSSTDRYEVRAGNAVATVRGTTFLVDYTQPPIALFLNMDGHPFELTGTSGESELVTEKHACRRATADGELEPCSSKQVSKLLNLPWTRRMLAMDNLLELKAVPTPGPTTTPAATTVSSSGTTRPTRVRPAPAVTTPTPKRGRKPSVIDPHSTDEPEDPPSRTEEPWPPPPRTDDPEPDPTQEPDPPEEESPPPVG